MLKPHQHIFYLFYIWGEIFIRSHLIKRFYCSKNISLETITIMGKKIKALKSSRPGMKSHILMGFKSNKIQTHYCLQGPVVWALMSSSLTPQLFLLAAFNSHMELLPGLFSLKAWVCSSPTRNVLPTPPLFFHDWLLLNLYWSAPSLLREVFGTFCPKEISTLHPPSQTRGCLLLKLNYFNN